MQIVKSYKNNLAGLYYIILGLFSAILSFLKGYEIVQFLYNASATILIIIGITKLIVYINTKSFGNQNFIMIDGALKILIGIVMLCVEIGVVSTIIGIILVIEIIINAILSKKFVESIKKSAYGLIVGLLAIFIGFDGIAVMILRIMSILAIVYGIALLIIDTTSQSKNKKSTKKANSEYVDASYEEVTSDDDKK